MTYGTCSTGITKSKHCILLINRLYSLYICIYFTAFPSCFFLLCRLKINHIMELQLVRLFLNRAWSWPKLVRFIKSKNINTVRGCLWNLYFCGFMNDIIYSPYLPKHWWRKQVMFAKWFNKQYTWKHYKGLLYVYHCPLCPRLKRLCYCSFNKPFR